MGFFVYTNSIDLHSPLSESKIFDGIGDGIGGQFKNDTINSKVFSMLSVVKQMEQMSI